MAAPHAVPLAHRHLKTKGTLSPAEWAQLLSEEARNLGYKITPKELAEGVATVQLESSGNADNFVQGAGGHIGGWAEGTEGFPSSASERLDPRSSTRAALKNWASNGKSWWQAWGQWEKEQGGRSGSEPSQFKQYLGIAEQALKGHGAATRKPSAEEHPKPKPHEEEESGGVGGELMQIGLVAVLVLGGVAMVGLGATRMLGTHGRPA